MRRLVGTSQRKCGGNRETAGEEAGPPDPRACTFGDTDYAPDMSSAPGDITRLLQLIAGGDETAVGVLWTRVHEEVRRMASAAIAREHAPTLEPTALVNEVWLRLHGRGSSPRLPFQNRAHFFAAVATTLGRLLVDRGRARSARKRGGHVGRVSFDDAVFDLTDGGLARLDDGAVESLDRLLAAIEALSAVNPRAADVVRLRFMVGLDVATVAEILGISTRTVYDDWLWSKAWLRRWLADS